jgi:hypothetical protein
MFQVRLDDDPRSKVSHHALSYGQTDDVFRQHVYRCHILPIKCPRCAQTFESSTLFTKHLREVSECDDSLCEDDEPMQGLETLLKKIRAPKITTDIPSEEDMWRAIYRNLFPADPKKYIPSPCKHSSPLIMVVTAFCITIFR